MNIVYVISMLGTWLTFVACMYICLLKLGWEFMVFEFDLKDGTICKLCCVYRWNDI